MPAASAASRSDTPSPLSSSALTTRTRSPSGSAAATSSAARTSGSSRSSSRSTTRWPVRPIGSGSGSSARPARWSASSRLAASTSTSGIPPPAATSSRRTAALVTPASSRIWSAMSSDTASTRSVGPVSVCESAPIRRVATIANRSNCNRRAMYDRVRLVGRSIHGRSSTKTTIGAPSAASTSRSRVARAMAKGSTGWSDGSMARAARIADAPGRRQSLDAVQRPAVEQPGEA